jgi:hypothetical protein
VYGVRPYGTFDTIIQFLARDDNEKLCIVFADHRPARDILEALSEYGEVHNVYAPSYMVQYYAVDA